MLKPLVSINPATEKTVNEIRQMTDIELEQALQKATKIKNEWGDLSYEARARYMRELATHLRARKHMLAETITAEMGKTLTAAEGEIEKCAWVCEYYAEHAKHMLTPEKIISDAKTSYVRFDPLGLILAIMPWNFPFWQVFRFAAPALMAGNVGMLKHASNVQGSADHIQNLFTAAGFPSGVFTNLALSSDRIARVIRDTRISAVTLTGGEKAGAEVARIAGEELKKTVLELGGSDPFIIFKDADIEQAAATAVAARMQNNVGQSCIAAKRFLVDITIEKEFTELLVAKVKTLVVGDPRDKRTHVGPLANERMLSDIERQTNESVAKGALVRTGGIRVGTIGFFFAPTVLTKVTNSMPAFREELFGPVFPISTFATEDEAIALANDTPYGLGATLFTKDTDKAERFAKRIESGSVFTNSAVKSDPRLPFGGVKKSGYGRELSQYGIKEFVNIKTISIA